MPERLGLRERVLATSIAGMLMVSLAVLHNHDIENPEKNGVMAIEMPVTPPEQQLGVIAVDQQITPTEPEAMTAVPLPEPTAIVDTSLPSQVPVAEQPKLPAENIPEVTYPVGCEQYRPLVAQYDWPVDIAMLVMVEESDCDPNEISDTNDYGLMQLNGIPILNPAENIDFAYHNKYVSARRGERNWSAWYAVCTPAQVPKFDGVDCG